MKKFKFLSNNIEIDDIHLNELGDIVRSTLIYARFYLNNRLTINSAHDTRHGLISYTSIIRETNSWTINIMVSKSDFNLNLEFVTYGLISESNDITLHNIVLTNV